MEAEQQPASSSTSSTAAAAAAARCLSPPSLSYSARVVSSVGGFGFCVRANPRRANQVIVTTANGFSAYDFDRIRASALAGEQAAPEHTLSSYDKLVRCVAFRADGERFALVSWDRTVRLFDARSFAQLSSVVAHPGDANGVEYHPLHEHVLLSCNDAGHVVALRDDDDRLVELSSVKVAQKDDEHLLGMAISRNGAWMATVSSARYVYISYVGGEHWRKADEAKRSFAAHADWARYAVFSRDSRFLFTVGDEGRLCVFRLAPEYAHRVANTPAYETQSSDVAHWENIFSMQAHGTSIWEIVQSSCGRFLATSSSDKHVHLYRVHRDVLEDPATAEATFKPLPDTVAPTSAESGDASGIEDEVSSFQRHFASTLSASERARYPIELLGRVRVGTANVKSCCLMPFSHCVLATGIDRMLYFVSIRQLTVAWLPGTPLAGYPSEFTLAVRTLLQCWVRGAAELNDESNPEADALQSGASGELYHVLAWLPVEIVELIVAELWPSFDGSIF